MYRAIPGAANVVRLFPDWRRNPFPEDWFVQHHSQAGRIEFGQRLIDSVDPHHRSFESVSCMKAGRAWISIDVSLTETGTFGDKRKLLLEKLEIGGDFHAVTALR